MKSTLIGKTICHAVSLTTPGALADVITYTYTGNTFTFCSDPDSSPCTPTGYLSATISLSSTLPANMPFSNLTGDLVSAIFTDNGQNGLTLTFPGAPGDWTLEAGTGTDGQLTSWTLEGTLKQLEGGTLENVAELYTQYNDPQQGHPEDSSVLLVPPYNQQYQQSYEAHNVNNPGSWACTSGCGASPVPEPSMYCPMLIGLGLLGLMRKRRAPVTLLRSLVAGEQFTHP
jgi:hypothetical protein